MHIFHTSVILDVFCITGILTYNIRFSLFERCLTALHAFVMMSRASVQSACPGVNDRSCLAPTNAEILLVREQRRACKQRESCPQPVVLKHSHGPCLYKAAGGGPWGEGRKEERTISSALVLLHWTGVKVQSLGSCCNSEGIWLFVLCLPAKSYLFSGAPQ